MTTHLPQIEELDQYLEVQFELGSYVDQSVMEYVHHQYLKNNDPRSVMLIANELLYMDRAAMNVLAQDEVAAQINSLVFVVRTEVEKLFARSLLERLAPIYPVKITTQYQKAKEWLLAQQGQERRYA